MSAMFSIEFKNEVFEDVLNTDALFARYEELKKNNEVENIKQFWTIIDGLMHKMSHYEVSRTLDKGKAPENGYIIKKESSDKTEFVSGDGFITDKIKYALFLSKEQAQLIIKEYSDRYKNSKYTLQSMTKTLHDEFVSKEA